MLPAISNKGRSKRGKTPFSKLRQRISGLVSGVSAPAGPSGIQQPVAQPQQRDIVSTRSLPQNWHKIWTSFGQPELTKLPQKVHLTAEHVTWLKKKGYKIGKELASGSYGTVYAARQFAGRKLPFMKKTKVDVAVKVVSLGQYRPKRLHPALLMITTETGLICKLNHPNVVTRINVFNFYDEDSAFPFPIHTVFFMELMKGDLKDYIRKEGHPDQDRPTNFKLTEDQARQWFKQIVSGLKYLHDQDIAHCDLKLQNILYNLQTLEDGSEQFVFKLTDFGYSMNVAKVNKKIMKNVGTPLYQTPEAKLGVQVYVYPTDIYALGVALMFSIAGLEMFAIVMDILEKTDNWSDYAQQALKVNSEFADLWEKMVCHKVKDRITIDKLEEEILLW